MKKLLLMPLVILMAISVYAETIIITETCQIRDSENYKTSKKIGVALKDEVFQTTGKFGDWYKVDILDIKTSLKYQGWIWQGIIAIDKDSIVVLGQGATLRSEPSTKTGEVVAYIFPNSTGKIIQEKITWYKINRQEVIGWVSTICCKIK